MNLKEKAKTTADISCTLEQMRLDDANVFLDKQWVLLADAEAEIQSWKEYTDYQLRQKDGIIERLNETIEHQENECLELETEIARYAKELGSFNRNNKTKTVES